jgi:hypothetical protein
MGDVACVVVPRIVKRLAKLNAEGHFLVDRDSLAMLAAVDGETSVAELARIHGTARTHHGLESLLGIGAVQVDERDVPSTADLTTHPSYSSASVTDDRQYGVGFFAGQTMHSASVGHARRSVARVSRGLRSSKRGNSHDEPSRRRLPSPPAWLRWSVSAAGVAVCLVLSFAAGVHYARIAQQTASPAITYQINGQIDDQRDSGAATIQATPGARFGGCDGDAPCAVAEGLATIESTPVAVLSSGVLIASRNQPTAQPTVRSTIPAAATPGSGSAATVTVSTTANAILAAGSQAAQAPGASVATVAPVAPTATTASVAPTATTASVLPTATTASVAPTATTAAAPPIAPSRRVVLDERFGDNGRGWPSNPQSTAWLADGGYRLFARDPGRFVAIGVPSVPKLRDVTMTGSFRKVGGASGGGYGLIVRDQGDGARDGLNQGGHYFILEVGDRGEIGVWQRDGNRWIDRLAWTASAVVRPGNAMNELTVRALGDRITFLVNGTEVTTQMDETPTEGALGIFTGGDGNQAVLERLLIEVTE